MTALTPAKGGAASRNRGKRWKPTPKTMRAMKPRVYRCRYENQ